MKRYIVVQPALPSYRIPLYTRLAKALGSGFSVYSSAESLGVLTDHSTSFEWHHTLGRLRKVGPGLYWQSGAMGIEIHGGDVLIIAGEPRRVSNMLLMLKARILGAETIWWGHYWSSTSGQMRSWLRFLLMKLSSAILFYTDDEIREYLAAAGRSAERRRVFALNNGLETAEIDALRSPYSGRNRGKRIFFIGRLTEKANLQLLLSALSRDECYDIFLEIVGGGPLEVQLRDLADRLGISDRISWHAGTLDEQAIAAVANRCSLFVYPGGVGLSLIHAFAYGLPAIVHDNRWRQMPEIAAFDNNRNGVYFRFGDEESLADVLARALKDEPNLDRMSSNALATVGTSFNMNDMVSRFLVALSHDQKESAAATPETALQ